MEDIKGQVDAQRGAPAEGRGAEGGGGEDRGVTLRAVAFGLCLSVGVSLLANTVRYVHKGSYIAYSHMPMANLILCLLSVLGCAALARWFGRRFVFSSTEWITIFSMGFISALGPDYGVSGYLVGAIATPYYFSTPENEWVKYLHPYLPKWLVPSNEGNAMAWFYEGLPKGASIPWGVWAIPLLWWFMFLCAVGFACACVSIILHRQWSENEKLVYPTLTPIVEMTTRAGIRPGEMLACAAEMRQAVRAPVCCQPSAWHSWWPDPTPASPARFAAFAKEGMAADIRYLGSCCGAGPEHVRQMAEAMGKG
ncbi:MAG: hypothetical protein EXS64_04595 [Candidatus Latescibacteria bacterium]|nr:hypothetical protein [Candidatus Latescibacterota bacterium]